MDARGAHCCWSFLCLLAIATFASCEARRSPESVIRASKRLNVDDPLSDSIINYYFPPYEEVMGPTSSHQDNSHCIYPPLTPLPPSTTLPSPILPIQSPPQPQTHPSPPSPPEIGPGPPAYVPYPPAFGSSPPSYVPSPPDNLPGLGPPIIVPEPPLSQPPVICPPNFELSPPNIMPPSPPDNLPGLGPPIFVPGPPNIVPPIFVPGPPIFEPPVIYPPPLVPPPPPPIISTTPGLWCVAKPTVPDPIIEEAMNYACGSGADCKSIQPNGSCYRPDTFIAHASFAFNSYWQRTKVAGGTCDFGGTGMLVTKDPSYDGCHFNNF